MTLRKSTINKYSKILTAYKAVIQETSESMYISRTRLIQLTQEKLLSQGENEEVAAQRTIYRALRYSREVEYEFIER